MLVAYTLVPALLMIGGSALVLAFRGYDSLLLGPFGLAILGLVFFVSSSGRHEISRRVQWYACGYNVALTLIVIFLVTSLSQPLRDYWGWRSTLFCAIAWTWAWITARRALRPVFQEPVDTLEVIEHGGVGEVEKAIATASSLSE